MGILWLEFALIFLLIVANGVFSLAEMAVVSSRKARLRHRADSGSKGAEAALGLANHPHDFLSTVQIGITLVGTLAGAFGGATIAENFAAYLAMFPALAAYSESIAIAAVVLAISYVTLILGELVPKNIALGNPEGIASAMARPMMWLSRVGSPGVRFLTFSTKLALKLIPVKPAEEQGVTEEEIKVLIAEGTESGTFEEGEQELVEGVFRLADRRVADLMRPRAKVTFLDVNATWETIRVTLRATPYSRFPVIEGSPDRVIGVVHAKQILLALVPGEAIDLRAIVQKPLLLSELLPALEALDQFQASGDQMAIVIDAHNGVRGIVTLTDLVEAVVGDLHAPGEAVKSAIVEREDGSWLVDGAVPVASLREELGIAEALEGDGAYSTVGGLLLTHLRRIPKPGDRVAIERWRFEVVDMDGRRVDKVLVTRESAGGEE